MTLTNRLLLFFLGTLAVVLVGFSLALYLLAHNYLYGQADERLEAATNTLLTAVEVAPDGVEWEPVGRAFTPGGGLLGGAVVWVVQDEQGRVVDRSPTMLPEGLRADATGERAGPEDVERLTLAGQAWVVSRHWLRPTAGDKSAQPPPEPGKGQEKKYAALVVTVAIPLAPVSAALRTLAFVLSGLVLAVGLAALAGGRWVCRRVLAPVTRMAASARGMNAADLGDRLPAPHTGDELDDLGRAFNGLLDRLQESFERQRGFTGDASHQLRTPLTAMLGQLEVALRRERPAEEYCRVLTSVQRQAGHLRRIVEALLFLARADAEARLPDLEPVDLAEWVPHHLDTCADCPQGNDLRFEIAGDGPHRVAAQPSLLVELVNNLLDNAVKYSQPGTPIMLQLGREGDAVTLSVEDHGCGIPEEELPRLFDPFFRSPAARRQGVGGVGLGLSVARRLAVAFGGRIEVTSRVGTGSRFTMRFPDMEGERGTDELGLSVRLALPGRRC